MTSVDVNVKLQSDVSQPSTIEDILNILNFIK